MEIKNKYAPETHKNKYTNVRGKENFGHLRLIKNLPSMG